MPNIIIPLLHRSLNSKSKGINQLDIPLIFIYPSIAESASIQAISERVLVMLDPDITKSIRVGEVPNPEHQ